MIIVSSRDPETLKPIIEEAYVLSASDINKVTSAHRHAVEEVCGLIDRGHLRVANFASGTWTTNTWAKKAILLFFRQHPMPQTRTHGLRR